MKEQPRRIPVHRSLIRPTLLAGAERPFTILNATFIFILVFGCRFQWTALITAAIAGSLIQSLLAKAAKIDPHMSLIYKRHIHYQRFYSAQSSVHAKAPCIKPAVDSSNRFL